MLNPNPAHHYVAFMIAVKIFNHIESFLAPNVTPDDVSEMAGVFTDIILEELRKLDA